MPVPPRAIYSDGRRSIAVQSGLRDLALPNAGRNAVKLELKSLEMAFNREEVSQLLVDVHRRCSICHRFCGVKIETDHIIPAADGGTDEIGNAIPVCFECHAEIHSYNDQHPRGRKFLEKENLELSAKLQEVTKTANLDSQAKCANQARTVFKEMGWDKEFLTVYTSHYDQKLNRCYIQVYNSKADRGSASVYRFVQDAFEGKGYAEYSWINNTGKKYWEVKPVLCKVTLLSGEEKICSSMEEFEELIKVYVEH